MTKADERSPLTNALEANLLETAAEVVIPDRYAPLLEAARPHFGLHQDLEALLKEYFHPFRNVGLLLEGLSRQTLGRWFQYRTKPDAPQYFGLFCELLWELLPTAKERDTREEIVRVLFAFWGDALAGPRGEEYEPSVCEYLRQIPGELIPAKLLIRRDNQLLSLAPRFLKHERCGKLFMAIYREVLREGLAWAAESLDVVSWEVENPGLIEDHKAVRAAYKVIDGPELRKLVLDLAERELTREDAAGIQNLSALIATALRALSDIPSAPDRFQTALFLLKDDVTGSRQSEVVSLLLEVLDNLLKLGNEDQLERIIYQLTTLLKRRSDFSPEVRLNIYSRIGSAIGRAGSARLASVLTDNLLSWPFEEPRPRGATSDWKVMVNPWHLRNVRCLLTIISSNPQLYQRLIAALTVFCRRGVWIPDTALFQKDISALLASDIQPVYHHIRQLCLCFPVFFHELGAEGELRRFSTVIDQETDRKDALIHFLRKAVHAETNNLLVQMATRVLDYWATGETAQLAESLPSEIASRIGPHDEYAVRPRKVLAVLTAKTPLSAALLLSPEKLSELVTECASETDEAREGERVYALMRVVQLLRQKYEVSADLPMSAVTENLSLPRHLRERFADVAKLGQGFPLLDSVLEILEHLKEVILSRSETKARENIYYKRHVAAGIPSMYGDYHEPRFDAMSLTLRLESLALQICTHIGAGISTEYVSKEFLWSVTRLLRRYQRALEIDGLLRDSFRIAVDLLEKCLESYRINYFQFRNILKLFLATAVRGVINGPIFGEYGEAAARIVRNRLLDNIPEGPHAAAELSEVITRETLASAFGLQELDAFVVRICEATDRLALTLSPDRLVRILNFRNQRLLTYLHDPVDLVSDPMHLGSKGFSLKRMANYGFNIPRGFVISTELFSIREALSYEPLYRDVLMRLHQSLDRLEKETGKKIGDPANLLMLSVRSSGATSMPGMMTTFLNVGLNDDIVEGLSKQHNYGWTSWDCYRRFLQCWGMSEGIERDVFDNLMKEFKRKYKVSYKLQFTANVMREIAFAYKETLTSRGITVPHEPREQVFETVRKVLASWDDDQALVYRKQMDIADDWGTAVVVQQMVLGNINYDSGTGVVFTHPPQSRGLSVELSGDFVFCSQGEDLVAGLVFPLPISEKQRREHRSYRSAAGSLETQLPRIYAALLDVSRELVTHRGFEHQEIEFTFESSKREELYILQSRPMVFDDEAGSAVFEDTAEIWGSLLATGLGSGGGAFSGRIVLTDDDILLQRMRNPADSLLLVRPDTVPEDVRLIVECKGLLTARGGGTSHAAITAKKLGKTCVVNCRAMEVDDQSGTVKFGDRLFRAGDWLSIDGRTGNIFAGRHAVKGN